MVTLVTSVSSYWTAYELDDIGRSPRLLSFALGVMFCVPGMLWLLIQWRWREEPTPAEAAQAPTAQEELLETRIG